MLFLTDRHYTEIDVWTLPQNNIETNIGVDQCVLSAIKIIWLFLLVASTLLYATFARYAFNYNWNWSQSLMFGGMISNVDPVTVYNIVKDISQGMEIDIRSGQVYLTTYSK